MSAANYEGTATLVGSGTKNNVITASSEGTSMWGGGASNDTLIGGNGDDYFWYTYGSGKDEIQGATENDVVVLEGISLDLITAADVSNNAIKISFEDGGTLSLNTNAETVFRVGGLGGTAYTYDKSSKEWSNA